MAHSSLLGIDRRVSTASGHDTASLGPSDSSDSGSDVAGLDELDGGDPGMPVDVATANDREHPDGSVEAVGPGIGSDAAGTGERRSALADAGTSDAPDIAPDRVVNVCYISAALDDAEVALNDELQDSDIEELAQAPDADEDDEAEEDQHPQAEEEATPALGKE